MEMKQKECGIVCKENGTEQIGKITEEEWRLLKQWERIHISIENKTLTGQYCSMNSTGHS